MKLVFGKTALLLILGSILRMMIMNRHETGTHVFNHGDFDMYNFRVARAYAQDDKYRMGCKDGSNLLTFSLNPNRV